MASLALVNPKIITWARQRAGLNEAILAKKAQVKLEKLISWEEGTHKPTFNQAQKLAKATHIPFGYFFLSEPPKEKLPIPDLRTVDSAQLQKPSIELLDTIKRIMVKQEWYKEYLITQGEKPLPFVGSFNVRSPVHEVAESIRKILGVDLPTHGTGEQYQRMLVDAAESAGILIMRNSTVGNTRRKLLVGEFRGFAISDPIAPLVFINNADAPAAKLFTLIHELAHIWIGTSGISDLDNHNKEEFFCNQVAGEFLVPQKLFFQHWKKEDDLFASLAKMASKFHVSSLVIAIRALNLKVIDYSEYKEIYQWEMEKYKNKNKKKDGESSGGPDFYLKMHTKNGNLFSKAVVNETLSGHLLYRDAGKLLDINPSKIKTYASGLHA